MIENKGERLNSEGIGPNGKITIEVTDIEFLTPIKQFDAISIRIKFGDKQKTTKAMTVDDDLIWHEKFEL